MAPTTQPISQRMVALANPGVGARVLDLATGTGAAAIIAARIVGPQGWVAAIDLSPAMLAIARRHAARARLANIAFQAMAAESLDFPEDSFDAVLCSLGLMLFAQPQAALREAWRVTRPGRRLALSVWGAPEKMWMSRVVAALQKHVPQASPGGSGPFAFSDPEVLEKALAEAGFSAITLDRSEWPTRLPSLDVAWKVALRGGPLALAYPRLPLATRRALRRDVLDALAPFADPSGVTLPFEVLFASARKRA
jgi:ubiquinone/menaquinone biosynthesis C-methylase UbiE